MFDFVRPHRRQPTRLPHPWDSPGKNTGVGCHFLLQCMKVKNESEVTQSCLTQRPHGLQPTRLLRPWDFPGKSTGVGCHCLLLSEPSLIVSHFYQTLHFRGCFPYWFPLKHLVVIKGPRVLGPNFMNTSLGSDTDSLHLYFLPAFNIEAVLIMN